ncbi:MAG: metal-dependent hydrolase [Bacteroidales bacterium]|nr:metal-dependent hydrolase [Bacteroidales bacterium]
MAGFRMHVTVSTALGIAYGAATVRPMGFGPETAVLATGLTAVGGMLPDLDSDSGRPVRELTSLAAVVAPIMLVPRLIHAGLSHEGVLAVLMALYLIVRYCLPQVIGRLSVHRGMYHSIPAMLIAGLIVYLEYGSPDRHLRIVLAVGVMLGFLSHLVLDEIYSVDINGIRIKLKSSAGSAVKLFSESWGANLACYAMLGVLLFLVWVDLEQNPPAGWLTGHPVATVENEHLKHVRIPRTP